MRKVTVNGKFEIILPEHRADRPQWYTEEGWEKKRLESMHKSLGKDDILFYVGAEEGDMPALCQMWGAELVLFEPNPKVWPNIKAIWEANKLEPAWCFVGFASNETSNPEFLKDTPKIHASFPPCADGEIISDHGFMELRSHNAPEVRLDDVVGMINKVPTAISIDVEGSEWQVLRGSMQILKKVKPKLWLSLHPEFMYEHYKEYAFDLRYWLKNEFGYKETLLDYQHEVHLLYE